MTITKYGHCCLLIEETGLRILTDPGSYSTIPENVKDIDVVLLTHDHADHVHVESLKHVLAASPNVKIFTNATVGELLKKEEIGFELLTHGQSITVQGILVEAFGEKHAVIVPGIPQSENTGYFINNIFFYPGDAFTNPEKPVKILALPVAGPWLNLSEAVEYAKAIHPDVCFPVHDGILKQIGTTNVIPPKVLEPLGIKYRVLEEGKQTDLSE